MAQWIGFAVSVNCGDPLGFYQGTILEADGFTITLTKAFRNGFPYPKSQVTLNASDIKELKIISGRASPPPPAHSTVAVSKGKKGQRATVCESLQAIPANTGNQSNNNAKAATSVRSGSGQPRSKPIDIQGGRSKNNNNNNNNQSAGSYGGGSGSTPRAHATKGGAAGAARGAERAGGAARRRNDAAFGEALDPEIHTEFDFEKNLALFDKQALWEEMRHSHKPDLVRQTEGGGKYRHDENILGGGAAAGDICAGPAAAARGYVTDLGRLVPALRAGPRAALWRSLPAPARAPARVLLARAAADVALRLVGGGRRLDARNTHQVPTVVALVGDHYIGACGVTTARILASHGVDTCVWVCGGGNAGGGGLGEELQLYLAAGGRALRGAGGARPPAADLLLLALHDVYEQTDDEHPDIVCALEWAAGGRAGAVCVEPPALGYRAGLAARASVAALLPPALPAELGRLYLADVAPPPSIFSDMGISYRPPFGAASALPLHAADD
ncbi:enhancer of mRNA-decapping protein 3 isoform X1 [Plutella xylostella]|uniref:enhancer of mRNA-decapping protein 3 isoform X1 n=1 Tax=Plutella xylostella TaxID=51655 RepID=UPI002032B994|nr:enhancer of mRNA-decapping protein 3 isoform X1 [Plutella xylostella]